MTAYGFVVVAWLIFPWNDGQVAIPFATMDACMQAMRVAAGNAFKPTYCAPTGAKE